jgi:DNA-binding NarL/FixJ family response regulator
MTDSPPQVRLLIADDHALFRLAMRTLLGTVPGLAVVGEAKTGAEAVELAAQLAPDLVLMDLQMPGGSGIQATHEITRTSRSTRVLVVTLFQDDDSVFAALRAGAIGYVLKDTDEEELIRAIRAVANGEAIFGPAIATRVLAYFAVQPPLPPPVSFLELTVREREILQLVARGHSNPEIAGELSLSPKTVANHVSNIFGKLQVSDRVQAVIRAREAGLG